jgi:hypothetical protein
MPSQPEAATRHFDNWFVFKKGVMKQKRSRDETRMKHKMEMLRK